jgi:alanine racemase
VAIEDEVVVFGRQGNEAITADEVAADLNTINYEIVSTLTGRVARVYERY